MVFVFFIKKKLKGEFESYYRYRIGNYRLFYLIDNEQVLIVIVDLKQEKIRKIQAAVDMMVDKYDNDKTLSEMTSLDGEDFI